MRENLDSIEEIKARASGFLQRLKDFKDTRAFNKASGICTKKHNEKIQASPLEKFT